MITRAAADVLLWRLEMWAAETLGPVSSFAEKTVRPKTPFMEKPRTPELGQLVC